MKMKRTLFTFLCLISLLTQAHAGGIWEEGSQWDVIYTYGTTGIEDSTEVHEKIVTFRLLPAFDNYMALEETVTFNGEVESVQVQGYIRNAGDSLIYVRPVLYDGSIGDECLLYDFREPYEYGGTVRYGVIGGEVKEEFIDWQEDTLDYYIMNNGDTHCLPAWKGIIYQYGYIGGPMELFLLKAAPGKTPKPKPSNISHVIFSTKGDHKTIYMNSGEEDDEDDIIINYDEMLTDGTIWECLAVGTEQPDLKSTYTIQVKGDTIIGKRHCKQVYSSEHNIQKTMFEEGRKVYVVNEDGQPVVLLDFNLQDGDRLDDVTTASVWDQENQGYHYRTITIDMGFDCASYFAGDTAPWAYDLIEGIGVSKDEYLKQCFLNEENTISYMLRCWKEGTLVYRVPQEYVPFVREDVKWVYYYDNPIEGMGYEDGFIPYGEHYYTLEMKGDTVINGKSYKPVHLYSGESINEMNDTVPVYLREENKVVYGIIPDDKRYYECPIGIGTEVQGTELLSTVQTGVEFILYDFNDPATFYESLDNHMFLHYDHAELAQVGRHLTQKHIFNHRVDDGVIFGNENIIEGIGFVGESPGMSLNYFYGITIGMDQVINRLSHVIEDGEIVYKTKWYKEPVPDDYEYVPFVREGVKWVYAYNNPFWEYVLDMPEGLQYYSFEMKGDVQIGDKTYKPVVLTHYLDKEGHNKEVEDYTPICLREENKVVYAIHPDGIQHPQCPVGYGWHISDPYDGLPIYTTSEEFILYDFNDPIELYFNNEDFWSEVDYDGTWMMAIGGGKRKCHHYQSWYSEDDFIIEGIGYDGMAGFPLFYFETFITGLQVGYGLSHVIENDQIVYTGRWYDPGVRVGIDEVVTDKERRLIDENYYNLMGQSVGKDIPTAPGIYIHQGKKIVVR